MQSVVRRAQERDAAVAKPSKKCIDVACRRLVPCTRRPREQPTYRRKGEQCEQLIDFTYLKRRQAVDRPIDVHHGFLNGLVALREGRIAQTGCAARYRR